MYEWNVEDLVLSKQESAVYIDREKIYSCESEVSREDKIAFVDKMQDGKLSYLLSLFEKYEKDKENMPKDSYGNVKTVSLKAWIKRNDTKYGRPLLDNTWHYGSYYIVGLQRSMETTQKKGNYDTYEDLVDEVFHRQLRECENMERKYFLEHDEYSVLKKRFREREHMTTFGVHISDWSNGQLCVVSDSGEEREITLDELKELLGKYDQLDELVNKLTEETHITY